MKRLKGENVQILIWALYGLRQMKYDFDYFSPNQYSWIFFKVNLALSQSCLNESMQDLTGKRLIRKKKKSSYTERFLSLFGC